MERGQFVVGKYRLNNLLGSGGMAEVWSATNTFTERDVAIKFLNREVAKTEEASARFLKEAKVSARINHPNIIEVLDVGQTEDGQLFIVMELLTGLPLDTALRRQTPPMTLYELALVMLEVAAALAAAHRAGVVHRDLKPTNIYLHKMRDGVALPKVLDFGVSKFLDEGANHAITIAGTVLGSPLYMSPEQARGDGGLDGRTDVFAFGAILFEALAGYRAYEAKNFNALIVKIATTRPKSVDEHAPGVPESLRRVVRACMEVDLAHRVRSFDDVIIMLRAALPELSATPAHLPTHGVSTAVDPEATHALPVLRVTPAPPPVQMTVRRVDVADPSVSSFTPNTSYASIARAPERKPEAGGVVLALGVIAALMVIGALGAFLATRPSETGVMRGAPRTTAAPLPATSNRPTSGRGHLAVTSSPMSCAITIDGKDYGPSPVTSTELEAGEHQVVCTLSSGKQRSATVTVTDGVSSKYRFAFDD